MRSYNIWGTKVVQLSEDNYELEYLCYVGLGRKGKGKTIAHIKKSWARKQINSFLKRHGLKESIIKQDF